MANYSTVHNMSHITLKTHTGEFKRYPVRGWCWRRDSSRGWTPINEESAIIPALEAKLNAKAKAEINRVLGRK